MMDTVRYYSQGFILEELLRCARNRETVGSFNGKSFGTRPDVLQYGNDVIEQVKNGITSFHVSEERWSNALQLDPLLKRSDIERLRTGWDLVLDIDCPVLEYSNAAADLIVKAIKHHNIKSVSCKFSGNHGFHIGVPFESFPAMVNGRETRVLFPEAPRQIAAYLSAMIRKHLAQVLLEKEDIRSIAAKLGKGANELIVGGEFEPFSVLNIDTILISTRHLYRMPYSINEKSGLVSVPVNPDCVASFDKAEAALDMVKPQQWKFLDGEKAIAGEAGRLLVQALDFRPRLSHDIGHNEREVHIEDIKDAVPEQFFPPCIRHILQGIKDGKKRSAFILVNFLSSVGWSYEKTEALLREWNRRNQEPLREVGLVSQLRYHRQQKKKVLPPNCINQMYYKDIGACHPDNLCTAGTTMIRIKNPVNYVRRKTFLLRKEKKARIVTEEQKGQMRKTRAERKAFKEGMLEKKASQKETS